MTAVAADLVAGNSNLLLGPLGNVYIGFDGALLGKTTDDTSLTKDEDVKDIMYSQDGTKAADHVSTGMLMSLSATFAEISTALLKKLVYSFSSEATSGDDSGTFGRYVYASLRTNKAKVLKVWATDSNGAITGNDYDTINFYEVLPLVDENLINWGADTQRNLPVKFQIYFKEFGVAQVAGGPIGAFGYYGAAVTEKVPAVVWPGTFAPVLLSAVAADATSLILTFNKDVALTGGSYAGGIIAEVEGEFIAPTGVAVTDEVADATFGAASFTAGDVIKVSISNITFVDTESTPNVYPGINGGHVVNSV